MWFQLNLINFIFLNLFLAALGHHCFVRAFSGCGFRASCWDTLLLLQSVGSRVHTLSFPVACGTVLGQGSKLCSPYWQTDSYPLAHQEVLNLMNFFSLYISKIPGHTASRWHQKSRPVFIKLGAYTSKQLSVAMWFHFYLLSLGFFLQWIMGYTKESGKSSS